MFQWIKDHVLVVVFVAIALGGAIYYLFFYEHNKDQFK